MSGYKTKTKISQQVVKQATHIHTHHCHQIVEIDLHHGGRACSSESPIPDDHQLAFVIPPHCTELVRNLPTMMTEWTTLPFAIPTRADDHKTINEILTFSLRQQKEEEISDNAGFVTIIIHRCLKALGIDNQIAYGYRTIEKESYPHVWLVIQGYVIDNTYLKELSEHKSQILCSTTPDCYEQGEYSYPEMNKPHPKANTPVDTVTMTNTIMKKRIEFYLQRQDRALALTLNREQSYNYYFAMIRHMFEQYKVTITGIDPKIRFICWCCGCYPKGGVNFLSDIFVKPGNYVDSVLRSSWKFPHCGKCMVASYCSGECQRQDWYRHHSLFCLSRGSVYLPPLGDIPFLSDPST